MKINRRNLSVISQYREQLFGIAIISVILLSMFLAYMFISVLLSVALRWGSEKMKKNKLNKMTVVLGAELCYNAIN